MNRWKDTLGIIASVGCAIHCAATPVLIAFLPSLKLTEWMASPLFHQWAAIFCVTIVSISIWPMFRRFGDYRVLSLSSLGLGLIIAAAFFMPSECCSLAHVETTEPTGVRTVAFHDHNSHDHSHAGHTHGTETNSVESFGDSTEHAMNGWLAFFQPWMTPLGGVFLVLAHILNLRRRMSPCGAKCGCHQQPSVSAPMVHPISASVMSSSKVA